MGSSPALSRQHSVLQPVLPPLFKMFFVQALFALGAAALAAAETHTIHFDNACGYGTVSIFIPCDGEGVVG